MTWPQAVTCALTSAFPEAAPWTDPVSRGGWIADAAELVQADLATSVQEMFGGGDPSGWQALLWLRGSREIRACRDLTPTDFSAIEICVAQALYPEVGTWPPKATGPAWKLEFYSALRSLVRGNPPS